MDDLDYLVKLDELYSLQLRDGLKLSEALAQVGLAKSTYDGLDIDFKRKTKEDVAKRILAARHEAETEMDSAVAEMELEVKRAELLIKRKAIESMGQIIDRQIQVALTGGDFNSSKASEVVANFARNGLQPDRRGTVVLSPAAPAPALPALSPARSQSRLPMPSEIEPADRVDLPTEARVVEKFEDGTVRETVTVRKPVLDSAAPQDSTP